MKAQEKNGKHFITPVEKITSILSVISLEVLTVRKFMKYKLKS